VETKKLNGQVYDVHTVKKVQLYPLYAGKFEIDPMEVKSKVSFSRSAVNAVPGYLTGKKRIGVRVGLISIM
jgi:hypothetical protein